MILTKARHIITALLLPLALQAVGAVPEGQMVKIAIDHTGIYRITADRLTAMGLGDASGVTIYGSGGVESALNNGGTVLPEVASMVTEQGDLLFYGEGPERYRLISTGNGFIYGSIECNSATLRGYYYLAPSSSPKRITTTDATPGTAQNATHISMSVYHPQTTNPARAGSTFLGDDLSKCENMTAEFPLPTPNAVPQMRVGLRVRGGIKSTTPKLVYRILPIASVERTIYAATTTESNYDELEVFYGATAYANSTYSMPRVPVDMATLRATASKSGEVAYAAIESATLVYYRYNVMPEDGTPLSMYFYGTESGSVIPLTGADATTCVWNVTDATSPTAMTVTATAGSAEAVISDSREGSVNIIAFDPAGKLGEVEPAGTVTLSGLSSMPVPEMVIVSAPALREEAERIADMHRRHNGMTVAVVEPQEVFDEFGSGSPSPRALRRFVKSLYDRGPQTLKHLLIVGASTYDPAGRTIGIPNDPARVLTYETEDFTLQGDDARCYCTDAFFGMLDSDDFPRYITGAKMSINVGRIPAASPAQVRDYVDKAERYLKTRPAADAYTRALVIGDFGDENGHTKQAMELADSIENHWGAPYAAVTRAISGLYEADTRSRRPLLDKVNATLLDGVGYMSYSGHGNPIALGSGSFLSIQAVSSLSNKTLPVVMLATCYALGFDREDNSVGDKFVFNRNGGALGLVASGRSVRMTYNQDLNMAMGSAYYKAAEGATLGDLFRTARNEILDESASNQLIINTSCYNFVGDPALPLHVPGATVDIDNADNITIVPLADNTISGTVRFADDRPVDAFDGTVTMRIYAPARTDSTHHDPSGCELLPVTRREHVVARGEGVVKGGKFSVRLQCPETTLAGDDFKLIVHASDESGTRIAAAAVEGITMGAPGDRESLDDGVAPEIAEMWINSPDFNDGDIVDATVILHAVITPSATGLDLGGSLGRTMYVTVDGTRHTDLAGHMSTDTDGTATLTYPVANLTDGKHTLTLSVADCAGNRAERMLVFSVITNGSDARLAVDETTAIESATFTIDGVDDTDTECRLVIDDAAGNTVFSAGSVSFPYVWNLTDNYGNAVADGRYRARVMMRSGMRNSATEPVRFVVVKE